jgi:hypothetical protein
MSLNDGCLDSTHDIQCLPLRGRHDLIELVVSDTTTFAPWFVKMFRDTSSLSKGNKI